MACYLTDTTFLKLKGIKGCVYAHMQSTIYGVHATAKGSPAKHDLPPLHCTSVSRMIQGPVCCLQKLELFTGRQILNKCSVTVFLACRICQSRPSKL